MKKRKSKIKEEKKEFIFKICISILAILVLNGLFVGLFKVNKDLNALRDKKINQIDENIVLKEKIKEMTGGYPIEKMTSYIARKDDKTAAFLISIAKKESNWGKRSPKLNGKDCFNYWGFRAKRERMGTGGHTCFDNPRDAVNTVAKRIDELIEQGLDSPEEIIVWKCGYSCDGHSKYSVNKWISDVDYYYGKFLQES